MFPLSKRLFYFIICVQVFLLLIVGMSLRQFIATSDRIGASDHLLVAIDAIGQTLLNAETGQRGYIITGDTEYLHPYNAAQITLPDQLEDIKKSKALINRHNPRLERVTQLVREKMAELQNTIDLVRSGANKEAVNEVKSGRGKELMDEIRVLLAEITTNQSNRIDEYQQHLKAFGFAMLSGLMAICGLGVLFVRRLPPEDGPHYST
jgi:CHASE3 domain sensor protein